MTHEQRMAALVAAGGTITDNFMEANGAEIIGVQDMGDHPEPYPIVLDGAPQIMPFFAQAANARPSIALAAEGMKALKLYRAATKQRADDEREHCAAGLTYSIEDLVAIEERIDKLLAQWEERT